MLPREVLASWWDTVAERTALLWRGVEAQHIVATLRLVDSVAEQQALEELLEESKPPLPPHRGRRHYLVTTPFRYRSPHASRFRAAGSPGVWYGAEDVRTCCAEVAYWRWRFLRDTRASLGGELLTTHTLFAANVAGRAVDLSATPWSRARASWMADDYGACHALADACVARGVDWVRYESARDPERTGLCGAVFTPDALTHRPGRDQTWQCKTTLARVVLVHDDDAWSFEAADWARGTRGPR